MRRKMIEEDLVEAVIALGENLFYNSAMESCILVCRTKKPKQRRNRILLINAYDEVKQEKTVSFLEEDSIQRIAKSYKDFSDEPGFSIVLKKKQVLENDASLLVTNYLSSSRIGKSFNQDSSLESAIANWAASAANCDTAMSSLFAEDSSS